MQFGQALLLLANLGHLVHCAAGACWEKGKGLANLKGDKLQTALTECPQLAGVKVVQQSEESSFHVLHIGNFGDKGMMFYWTIVELIAVGTGVWHRRCGILAALQSRCVLIAIAVLIVIVGFRAIVVVVLGGVVIVCGCGIRC